MFRIKNVRNATVAKQTKLTPSLNPNLRAGAVVIPNPLPSMKFRAPINNGIRKLQETNLKGLTRNHNKLEAPKKSLISKAHAEDQVQGKKLINTELHHNNLVGNTSSLAVKQSKKDYESVEKIKEEEPLPQNKQQRQELQLLKEEVKEEKLQTHSEKLDQEKLLAFIAKQEEARTKAEQKKLIDTEYERKAKQKQEQRKLERERQKEQQRLLQLQREKQLQEMTKKINARKKAREQQRQRDRMLQESIKKKMEENLQGGIGGLVSLDDALSHIQMSDAIMDQQVNMLLRMNFTNFPNKEALERQRQELDRINQSYIMVRGDPGNKLARGLANFRIQLFNRVGEFIMASQRQMGDSASGLRMVEGDYLNNGTIEGVRVTRGLQGHVKKLLKPHRLNEAGECPICLGQMQKGEQVYEVKCGHEFHMKCLEDWLGTTANCPACRYNIKFDHK